MWRPTECIVWATLFQLWDGQDHLGQIVAPGTYIIHIEVMDPITGDTHTDAAPVVVGVKN